MSDKAFAEMLGISDKTVSRALKTLEDKGLIKRETKNVRNGKERHIHITNGQNDSCKNEIKELATDNLSFAQQTICPLPNGQNDFIKENNKNINIKKDKLDVMIEMAHNLSNSDGSFKM